MAALAAKQDAKQVTESAKVDTVAKSPLTQALVESEKWIQKAVNPANKGNLHKALHVAQGEKIPKAKIAKATHSKNPKLRHMAQFAKNVAKEDMTDEGNAFTGALAKTPKGGKFKVGNKEFKDTSSIEENYNPVKAVKQCAKDYMKMNGIRSVHDLEAEDIESIGGDCQINYQDVCEILGCNLPDSLGPVKSWDTDEHGNKFDLEEGYAEMDAWLKSREKEKGTGRFDKKKISTGTVYTRKPETFDDPETDPEATGGAPKRKGRPAGTKRAIGAKQSGRSKLARLAPIAEEDQEVCKHCGQPMVAEKAPPGAKAERMVKHIKKAYSKDGELTPKEKSIAYATAWKAKKAGKVEEEGAKPDFLDVDKDGDKKEPMKQAAKQAKAKGKQKEEVEETTTSGSVATATEAPKASKGGMQFGKGVYESLDVKLESMISESISVQENIEECGMEGQEPSITITASGEEAAKLMALLKLAGLEGKQDVCPTCGSADCQCNELDENSPDWPTNTEKLDAEPNLRTYSGGLNGPKSTGQTTTPVIASQLRRQVSMEENVELERSLFKTWKNYKG